MSGVNVVVGTPPALLRIYEKKILDLKDLRHIVSICLYWSISLIPGPIPAFQC